MLWKELAEQDCCDNCPLLKNEICTGGFVCYGGRPIEPPCLCFDDDTDLDEWVLDYFEQQRRREEWEEDRLRQERKKKERARKAADTRRALRWYCFDEIQALKRAKKALKAQQAIEQFASSFAQAINITNEMFQYEERATVNPAISDEIKRLEEKILAAKERYDSKRKEFYDKRRSKENNG